MIVIALANQKGGVGKTTSAVTLADGLRRLDLNVLLVDLDGQGNVADCLGLEAGCELTRLLFPGSEADVRDLTIESRRPRLSVIRADKSTGSLKAALAGDGLAGFALYNALMKAEWNFDVAILDCAPSIDILHTAALVAADYLIVPTRLDQLAVKGVRDILQSVTQINRTRREWETKLLGVLPTFYDRVTSESHQQLVHLAQVFGQAVLPPIPQDTNCRTATRLGETLFEHAPGTRALIGITNGNGKYSGGYLQVIEQVKRIVES